jgi:L-ribulokinase
MAALALPELRDAVWRANLALAEAGLVTLSFGNASGLDPASRIDEAARAMAHLRDDTFVPIEENRRVYDVLFREYLRLHDLFGRGVEPAMKTLKRLRLEAVGLGDPVLLEP